jgi:ubiquinol-cytochrome c reductase cytochrome b subunit
VWNVFLPAAFVPAAFFLIMGAYPFVEQWATGDKRFHLVLDRPRNAPNRTGLGVAIMIMGAIIQLAGADDVEALHFYLPYENLVWFYRIGFFVLPVAGFFVTRHICLALQRADRRQLRQGDIYGLATMNGAYAPVARPMSEEEKARMDARQPTELLTLTPRHLIPMPTPRRISEQVRARLNHFYLRTRLETPSARDGMDSMPGEPDSQHAAARQKTDH